MLTGEHLSNGPVDTGPATFRPLVPRLPTTARYQPREVFCISALASSIKPQSSAAALLPERLPKFRPEPEKSERARQAKRAQAQARSGANTPRSRAGVGGKPPQAHSVTGRILHVIKDAAGWIDEGRIHDAVGAKATPRAIADLLHRHRADGRILARRCADGVTREYCWGPLARAQDPEIKPREVRGQSVNSLSFAIVQALREAGAWLTTVEIAGRIRASSFRKTIDGAAVATRMTALVNGGHVERRRRENPVHRRGGTTEYRTVKP
ncbi:MAG: hypothetical protein EOM21_19185 [Gammaproteobacteria bacterium]|nr:hypothetical protein [Gammaproteobacteria bacterium]